MLHLDIEVQTIQFSLISSLDSVSMQFNDNNVTKILDSKIKCKCKEVQEIYERVELNIYYSEKSNLKLQFFDGNTLFGEAHISLGFYIENNLPLIIDNIPITNKLDSDAQVQVSLSWKQMQAQNFQQIRSTSPIRESPTPAPQPSKPIAPKKPSDEVHFEKRIVHATYAQWKDHQQVVRAGYEKKLQEPIKHKQYEDEKLEEIRKPEQKVMSPRRFQTPVLHKPAARQQYLKTSEVKNMDLLEIKQNGRAPSKSPNRTDSRVKPRNEIQGVISPGESSDLGKSSTKPKKTIQKGDLSDAFASSKPEGQIQSRKELDQENGSVNCSNQGIQVENAQLKTQVSKLKIENQQLRDQQIKSEAAFNLLSETYTTLRNEYQKIQVKSFNNSSSHSLLNNRETDHLRREIDQKAKEMDFIKKEAELWKKDIEVSRRENIQLKKECEEFRKEYEQKTIENEGLKREIDSKRRDIEQLEKELKRTQQAIELIQSDSLRSINQYKGNGGNQEILEQMKNLIKTKQIELDGKNEELKQNKIKIAQLEKEVYEGSRKIQDQFDQLKLINSQLELENQRMKKQIQDQDNELQQKTQEIDKLLNQPNQQIYYSQSNDFPDSSRIIHDQLAQIATLKQDNQTLNHQAKKDQVKLDTIQKELDITKNIVEYSDQKIKELEQEILKLENAVVNGKQNMADVINAVMECGGNQLAEEVERYLIIRRSMKVN